MKDRIGDRIGDGMGIIEEQLIIGQLL